MQGYREQWRVRSRDGEIKGLRERWCDVGIYGRRDVGMERAMSDIGMEGAMDSSIEGWRDKGIAGAMERRRERWRDLGSDASM